MIFTVDAQALVLPKTVALELEWVLRGYYGFGVEQAVAGLRSGQQRQLL